MTPIFVTSSGTDIGKTYVSAMVTRELRAHAIKPVVSGFDDETFPDSDTAHLLAAMGEPVTMDHAARVSRWRFKAALSPDMAAAREGAFISFDDLIAECVAASHAHDRLIIEGVGGLMVPLDETHSVLDWMQELNTHVGIAPLLVVGSYLGTISHTLTTLDVMQRNGLSPRVIVVSESENAPVSLEETMSVMARFVGDVPLRALPRDGRIRLEEFFPD